MRRRNAPSTDEADVNITPLLDIVFIMLIFFIVTATFVREVGLDVTRPNNQNEEDQPSRARVLLIEITEAGQILANRRPVDMRSVRANVETHIAEFPNGGVIISAAPAAPSGLAVQVLDQARAAGTQNVSLAIQEER